MATIQLASVSLEFQIFKPGPKLMRRLNSCDPRSSFWVVNYLL